MGLISALNFTPETLEGGGGGDFKLVGGEKATCLRFRATDAGPEVRPATIAVLI